MTVVEAEYMYFHSVTLISRMFTVVHTNALYIDTKPRLASLSLLREGGKNIAIIESLATCWKKLGTLLDFDEIGEQLDIIERQYPTDPEECCRAVFKHWLKGNGIKPCSWRMLIKLIGDCRKQELAENIRIALTESVV